MTFNHKKSLGQNFLKDNNIINKISSSITPEKDDLIIEIGPGSGALTKKIINNECDVICFEIDKRLKEYLDKIESNNLTIIYDDFLDIDLKNYILPKYKRIFFIGNLPYYITTAIINKIIHESNPYEIIIMIQKEVALRFMAKPNTKEYSSISVFLQYNFDISKVCDVSKNCFDPIPKVDSMVIKLKRKSNINKAKDEDKLYKLIRDSFKYKRKNLRNNLKDYDLDKIERILKTSNKDLSFRAEQLTISEFINISNEL